MSMIYNLDHWSFRIIVPIEYIKRWVSKSIFNIWFVKGFRNFNHVVLNYRNIIDSVPICFK